MNELHLFAGAGGGILGGMLLGHTCVCAVEIEPYPRKVLLQRQRDGILPKFPIWDDVKTFGGRPWRGLVDKLCAGFPCQDISISNTSGAGIDGERSGLWAEAKRIICEVEPEYVELENSPAITFRGLGRVLGDLAGMGYDARWGVLGAENAGGNHARRRFWCIAHCPRNRFLRWHGEATEAQREIENSSISALVQNPTWPDVSDPHAYGSNDGLAYRMERTRAIGNGQVPAVAALAWNVLMPEDL
jgi:DNA (cytosine-5)-methyltransferase 1